ncbi:MAG: hypothetical protein IMY81_02845 [Chloroflexi bacterium]|nr:hypothetical protein [Chloroflexota bacterium]
MDFFGGEGGSQWTMIIPLIGLIVFSIFMRRRKSENTPQDIASSLLSDLNANQGIVEQFGSQMRPTKLKIGSWQRNNDKLGFLDNDTRNSITNFFRMAEDFNMQIETAKRYKTTSYLSGISVEKLKEPLGKGREGLQEWMKANMQQAGPGAGRQGCLPGMGG